MNQVSRLLVVDDEDVICQGCRRIFAPQGFEVETSTDPGRGLSLACDQDFDAVLLDVRMPAIDGIQFLQQFRARKPDVPVILITGYPSIPDAAAAMRLGAVDYVTKPFTPEEISQAVRRSLGRTEAGRDEAPASAPSRAQPWETPKSDLRFVGQSWLEMGEGPVPVGALVAPSEGAGVDGISLPGEGDVVYQGLPLAGLTVAGKLKGTLPSPVSGVVVAVNPELPQRLPALWEDPFREGWIASISPARLEEEVGNCRPRRVILANADPAAARDQCGRLTALGCQVCVVGGWEELALAMPDSDCRAVILDADSLGQRGPELAGQVKQAAPSMRIVVISSASSDWEIAYRRHGIFYYSLAPFADQEILEIMASVFRPPQRWLSQDERRTASAESASSIFITNRSGRQVGLLVAGGLLLREDGLGWHVRRRLLDRLYPMRTSAAMGQINQGKILLAASMCDRLLLLVAKDMGRLPGSLVHDAEGRIVSLPGDNGGKTTTLAVQPALPGLGLAGHDDQTMAALAEHVVHQLESC
jgi:DNA-binding response OmpR family regulator/glycine cleavage system H lipoate-binding protein